MEGFPSIEEQRTWADQLEEVQERLAPYFERAEPRQRVMAYLRGLLSITERKNGWQLAELAGEATPDGMQRLLNTAQFQEQEVAQLLPLTVPEVRRLLWRLVWQAPPTLEAVLYWSRWRRRHQARAKQAHIKRRAARLAA